MAEDPASRAATGTPSTPLKPSEPSEPSSSSSPSGETTPRLPLRTYHCTFCNHLLLSSTRDISQLPRRKEPALDKAIILPLPGKITQRKKTKTDRAEDEREDNDGVEKGDSKKPKKEVEEEEIQEHYTILLSTTLPDRKPLMIRRSDGFEKRLLLRCGRCRVVVGYVLDKVHFPKPKKSASGQEQAKEEEEDDDNEEGEEEGQQQADEVVYVLPGALVETGEMGREVKVETEEWRGWEALVKG